ncbi:MAG: hypothetical protein VB088_01205 [Sphaerochaeta sp.]|nr:hypothetical protein [Sphaerochaeta sp.]
MSVELAGFKDTFPDSAYLEVLIFHQIPEKEENKTKGKNQKLPFAGACSLRYPSLIEMLLPCCEVHLVVLFQANQLIIIQY